MFGRSPLYLVLILALTTLPTRLSFADNYEAVCANAPNQPGFEQKAEYCRAAKIAEKAADADAIVWKLYAAAAAVCTYACAAALGSPIPSPNEYLCTGSSMAAGVTDGVVTKNYMSAVMGIVGPAGIYMMTKKSGAGAKGGEEAGNSAGEKATGESKDAETVLTEDREFGDTMERLPKPLEGPGGAPKPASVGNTKSAAKGNDDWQGPCFTAALSAVEAFAKQRAEQDSRQTAQDNLQKAQELSTKAASLDLATAPKFVGSSGSGGNSTGSSGKLPTPAQLPAIAATECNKKSGDMNKDIQCAMATDGNLPRFIADPRFPKAFEQASRQNLGNFVGSDASAAEAMTSGMAGAVSEPGKVSDLASLNRSMMIQVNETAAIATSGGGGAAHGSGSGDDDMGSVISGMMAKLFPGQGQGEGGMTGIQEVDFLTRTRGPAAVTQARNVSIFDRISYRYLYVQARMLSRGQRK